jgi:membrane protease YdiL (CAAX protease family)
MDTSSYTELWQEVKKYIALQIDYTKLTLVEKLTMLMSAIISVCLIIVLSACALFFLSAALVSWLEVVLNSTLIANLIVGCGILIILLLVFCLKKTLILNPVSRFVSKLFLNPPQK